VCVCGHRRRRRADGGRNIASGDRHELFDVLGFDAGAVALHRWHRLFPAVRLAAHIVELDEIVEMQVDVGADRHIRMGVPVIGRLLLYERLHPDMRGI
jgi:hypothetical protein